MEDHMMGHKPKVNKLKRTEMKQSMHSDYNEIKLEISTIGTSLVVQ